MFTTMCLVACLLLLMTSIHPVLTSVVSFTVTPNDLRNLTTDQKLVMICSLREDSITRSSDTNTAVSREYTSTNKPTYSDENSTNKPASNDVIGIKEPASVDAQHQIHHKHDDTFRSVTPYEMKYLSSIVITKGNTDVATVSAYATATGYDVTPGVQVSGQVRANGTELGYLSVVWDNPGPDQKGHYTCDVGGFDERGHAVSITQTVDVIDRDVSTTDLMEYIRQLQVANQQHSATIAANSATIANMSTVIQELQNRDIHNSAAIANMSTTVQDLKTKEYEHIAIIDNLSKTMQNFQCDNLNISDITSIDELFSIVKDNNATINQLRNKLTTHVAFTAGYHYSTTNVTDGRILKFDQVIFSVGGGFDPLTGVFTCPVAGVYLFHVHLMGQLDRQVYVYLRHNRSWTVRAWAGDQGGYQSASNSLTLSLAVGDTVDVIATGSAYPFGSSYPPSTFTGILVTMD